MRLGLFLLFVPSLALAGSLPDSTPLRPELRGLAVELVGAFGEPDPGLFGAEGETVWTFSLEGQRIAPNFRDTSCSYHQKSTPLPRGKWVDVDQIDTFSETSYLYLLGKQVVVSCTRTGANGKPEFVVGDPRHAFSGLLKFDESPTNNKAVASPADERSAFSQFVESLISLGKKPAEISAEVTSAYVKPPTEVQGEANGPSAADPTLSGAALPAIPKNLQGE